MRSLVPGLPLLFATLPWRLCGSLPTWKNRMIAESKVVRAKWDFGYTDHLSPSQIVEYLQCPACLKLSRIERVPRPLSVALPIGGAVHKAVEFQRQRLLDPGVLQRVRQGYAPGVMDELTY